MITDIKRELTLYPNIVSIISTDSIATITSPGYFSTQLAQISRINNGTWEWETLNGIQGNPVTDMIVIFSVPTSNLSWYSYDISTDTFSEISGGSSVPLPNSQILVGNASNVATPVAMSGDATISNSGVLTISPQIYVQTIADINNSIDIPNMYDAPILLIPAPGVNKITLIENILWFVFTDTFVTPFSGGGTISAQYGNAVHGAGPLASGPMPAATLNGINASTTILSQTGFPGYLNAEVSTCVNTSIYLSNLTGAFSYAGFGGITLLYIKYRILNF